MKTSILGGDFPFRHVMPQQIIKRKTKDIQIKSIIKLRRLCTPPYEAQGLFTKLIRHTLLAHFFLTITLRPFV
jgi:hypothetical protein